MSMHQVAETSTAPVAMLCTGNVHKVTELQQLLPHWQLHSMPAGTVLPEETGATLLDNARIKAFGGRELIAQGAVQLETTALSGPAALPLPPAPPYRAALPWVIADDSGLCVDALNGAPGVHSARFAGPSATDADNVNALLERLAACSDHGIAARFECVLVAVSPSGDELVATGQVHGHIITSPRGTTGFGYDPIFVPDGSNKTFAELGPAVKDSMSHRARAAASLSTQLDHYLHAAQLPT
jgi:XTP/dITP diphosphohydrolase